MIDGHLLQPNAVYDDGALASSLGLTPTTLARARQSGQLQFTRQGKRTLYLGRWVLAWLEGQGCVMSLGSGGREAQQ
jgi:hypothetical protein